jgi:ethanolamine ammonia-lyase small subunit
MTTVPALPDRWTALKRFTAARIALGRAGGSLSTAELLRFDSDHACARDAVHAELDLNSLEADLAPLGLPVIRAQSRATDRFSYLQRPDLGRRLDPESLALLEQSVAGEDAAPDVAIVIADGLSAGAAHAHAPPLLADLLPRLRGLKLLVAPLVVVRYARVAIQDEIGQVLAARSCVILLGERPGLAAADSLGAYFVFNPRIGNSDADRNCVSNIRRGGLSPRSAAETLEFVIAQGLIRRLSGTSLKDERRKFDLTAPP